MQALNDTTNHLSDNSVKRHKKKLKLLHEMKFAIYESEWMSILEFKQISG